MKTYFQLTTKEQNNNQPRSTKNYILNMKACYKINKKINFRNEIKGPKKELKSSQINRDKIKNIKLFELFKYLIPTVVNLGFSILTSLLTEKFIFKF